MRTATPWLAHTLLAVLVMLVFGSGCEGSTGAIVLVVWTSALAVGIALVVRSYRYWRPHRWLDLGDGRGRVGLSVRKDARPDLWVSAELRRVLSEAHRLAVDRYGARHDWLDGLHVIIVKAGSQLIWGEAEEAESYGPVPKIARGLPMRQGIHVWDDRRGFNGLVHGLMRHHLPWSFDRHWDGRHVNRRWLEAETELGRRLA